jgi:3-methyladenine DNA glycosylase AlkC
MKRKNFNYRTATVAQIVDQFNKSSPQAIYAVRKTWEDDEEMSAKVETAYREYKIAKLFDE